MDRSPSLDHWLARSQIRPRVRRPTKALVTVRGDALRLLRDSAPPHSIQLAENVATVDRDALVCRINSELSVCGCGQASAAMLITLPASAALAWWLLDTPRWPWIIAVAFVATGVAGTLGKQVARRRAEARYRRLLRQLANSFQ